MKTRRAARETLDLDVLSLGEVAERAFVRLGAFGKGVAAERATQQPCPT